MVFVVVLAIFSGVFIGFQRGFLKSAFKLLMTVLSVVLSYVLAPLIANWVITYTSFDDNLQASIATQIENAARQQIKKELDASVGQYGIPVTDDMINAALDTQLSTGQQSDMLNQISMPEDVRQNLINQTAQNTNGYPAQMFYEYVAGCLAKMIVRAVVYVISFVVITLIFFGLYLLMSLALRVASLGGANRVAGAVFGGMQALIYVWIAFVIIHYLTGTGVGTFLENEIQKNVVLTMIDNHNPLQDVAKKMITRIF